MPEIGDELHHFGWNACSSALCPWAPHPHVERRYLLVPGLRSSRIHVVDVKEDPRAPKVVKVIEAEEIARKAGYSRPHTVHCGPDGIYVSALGNPERRRPGRRVPARPRRLLGQGRLGGGPRPAGARLRLLVAPQLRHGDHQRVGDAGDGRGRPRRRAAARQPLRPPAPRVGPRQPPRTCRRSTSAPEHQMVLELRPAHDPVEGATGSSASSPRPPTCRRRVWLWSRAEDGTVSAEKVITIPAEPAEADQLPPILQPFGAVPPLVTDIALSVDDRSLYVSCWGTGELKRFDVTDPRAPRETGSVRLGGIVGAGAAPRRRARSTAGRRWCEVSRDGRRVILTNSLYAAWDAQFYPEGIDGWLVKLDAGEDGSLVARPRPVRRVQRRASAPGPAAGRRRLLRLVLLPGSLMGGLWPWVLMALLGAYHGLNPAMGWLFAVALGMQEGDRRAVLRALPPIALGHEAAIALAAALVLGLGVLADTSALKIGAGVVARRLRDLPLRQAARALPLGAARVIACELALVVVPHGDRARRGADGRARAARRGRGGRGGAQRPHARLASPSRASRSPRAASPCCLHVGAMLAVMGHHGAARLRPLGPVRAAADVGQSRRRMGRRVRPRGHPDDGHLTAIRRRAGPDALATLAAPRAISSAGRAPPRQGGGHWFEPSIAH